MKRTEGVFQLFQWAALALAFVAGGIALLLANLVGGYWLGGFMILVLALGILLAGVVGWSAFGMGWAGLRAWDKVGAMLERRRIWRFVPRRAPEHPMEQAAKVAFLGKMDLFAGLPTRELRHLAAMAQPRRLEPGDFLTVEHEPGREIFLIQKGQVQLFTRSRTGEVTVRVAGPGESLPLAVLMEPGIHLTSARAMLDTAVLVMDRDELLRTCRERPAIGAHVYRMAATVLARRYNDTLQRMTASIDFALQGRRTPADTTEGPVAAGRDERQVQPDTPPGGPASWPD